ncbi:MAG TPA: alpha/beta hydrolase [Noviherbaspirillum sp.]|jgi:pimeloyl-ACP methyl ester carboxylesterase|uniref:alpha/beta hydrolase family protein n=1 Tax=Noviherbaspirillum sp. TaxID=1926288 RepID=UPI002F92BBCF
MWKGGALVFGGALMLAGCGGGGSDAATDAFANRTKVNAPEESRVQDTRTYAAVDPAAASDYEAAADGGAGFRALSDTSAQTDRWAGMLGESSYRIEVPKNWNGKLVMYAHGYAGTGPELRVTTPSIRRHLIENGYAWAASSYSKNYYDVRVGVEDTNALANAFRKIAKERGRNLGQPNRTYIIGHSMGGHITGAAIEEETRKTAINKTKYDGAVPMCGVMGDTELFDYFAAYQIAAQTLAGYPNHPTSRFGEIASDVRSKLFVNFSTVPTAQGVLLAQAVKNLTGGERPVFNIGFANTALQNVVWGTFGSDGTVNGILNKNTLDTNRFVYQFDNDPAQSATEANFNASVQRLTAAPDANRLRRDGLRWIPKVNGEFKVPVVSLHTLGDMYVPFSMQQIYRQRAEAQGNGDLLVQRAVRAPSHCDFTVREQTEAFDAMINWAENGVKPAGDDVLNRATVAAPTYGCAFTRNSATVDDNPVTVATRQAIAPLLASCPS